jgi:peptidoglycan/LPS O-acetylase OafA/YrhL
MNMASHAAAVSPAPSQRLDQIDALRGIAAMAVVLFHLTTRFTDLYQPAGTPWLSFPLGHYGVNLFFMISGFVIFMTLQRTQRGMDFVVSRFSRLFPAYWVALAITWGVTHALGLPGREVSGTTALLNLPMVHNLFGVTHVDGAYWTLEIELLFYVGMYLLFRGRSLGHVHLWMIGLLALRWVYFGAAQVFGIDLPWKIYHLLILKYLPWFALGVATYAFSPRQHGEAPRRGAVASVVVALATLGFTERFEHALLAVAGLLMLGLAARGRLGFLAWRPWVWLGSISYPLYLLHEYVSWSVMLELMRHGVALNAAIGIALAAALLLAHIVSRSVERPAMRWIRDSWRARSAARQPA